MKKPGAKMFRALFFFLAGIVHNDRNDIFVNFLRRTLSGFPDKVRLLRFAEKLRRFITGHTALN